METLFILLVTVCLLLLLKSVVDLLFKSKLQGRIKKLPPGPLAIPIIGDLRYVGKSSGDMEAILRSLSSKFGPIVTLPIGSRSAVFISSRSLAHKALIQNGAVFADRPEARATGKIISSNQHNISSAPYGPTWRLLRRNLTAEILHPTRVKFYSQARKWVLDILLNSLKSDSANGVAVKVVDHFSYAMFCLLVLMCFGDKLNENEIKQIQAVQRQLLLSFNRFQILDFWPRLTRILLRSRWKEFMDKRRDQDEVLFRLIRARKQAKMDREKLRKGNEDYKDYTLTCYVDTLLELELEEDGGKRYLTEGEMRSLCSEFIDAGTDTTSTALQWIMANLVKQPAVQARLFDEINGVVEAEAEEVREEDLGKIPYLRAVILEGLRRHPPGHFVLPHTVREETELSGYTVPRKTPVNFMVAEIGWDPEVWEDPMEFKPERFLGGGVEEFDITGSKEIKMMPFGAGRRICPGYGLALLHLEYFVANLIWNFEWKAVSGDGVDLAEKQEFTIVMKHPLRAHISPRRTSADD
ncbi:hypothetical protein Nepgr_022540 [Nepenthes gracilis]|uniref:Cytochrome P450 n=1 Tax=Nepenthes gracilis TaxID=150966 RepID=A0AAD3XY67_NEPGR|nr:hypothetical protein Nepgr_022540 [Nepenthes gracilis]